MHHTAEHLDWIAAYREHPLDNLYTRLIENLPALILGFPLPVIAGLIAFRGLWGLVIHSNANLQIGPLKYILGSPKLHHWHHSVEKGNDCNYANLMPLMDLIFGAYHEPKEMPATYGISEKVSHNYFAQLATPLLPRFLAKKINPQAWRKKSATMATAPVIIAVEENPAAKPETDSTRVAAANPENAER